MPRPGEYRPDPTLGIDRPEDLPKTKISVRSRNYRRRPCPRCGHGAYRDRIGHVQIADAPGRGEPGTGDLPLGSYLEQLIGEGYGGYVGLEYKPTRADTFDWLPSDERGAHRLRVESLPRHTELRIQ